MNVKVTMLVALIFISATIYNLPELEIPERKIGRTIEELFNTEDFNLSVQNISEINCVDELYSKQLNIVQNKDTIGKVFIRRVHTCDPNACKNNSQIEASTDINNLEYFDYFMIVDTDTTIQNITVYNYQATHGHEVAKRAWLSQFIGDTNRDKEFIYGQTVDAISGATVSAENFTYDLEYVMECLKK